jgi:hypothetical protein
VRTHTARAGDTPFRAGASLRLVAILCLLAGCNARVDRFTATPRHVCPGQEVTLSWRVVGSATMTADPALPGMPEGHVADEGRASIAPRTSTRIALHVTRPLGKPTSSIQEIDVSGSAPTVEPLTASLADDEAAPGCDAGSVWATVHPKRFTQDITVATVRSHPGDGRTYRVRHAGVEATVAPGIVVHEFAGRPLLGDWVLTSPLAPGETCGTPTLPRSLVVDVLTQCVPGGAP